ncbi:hypothetical protein TrVE_jg7548 [Triparma verrucosa]|uniref:Fe2OG dioxygenase domain-containing protein n=1 Tax=Triparma verrucosa TaxID=1606542 RepID=A0A9W7EWD5_9STRA|nr:hypothetical protein TrVE_jg7548 [Triparma verrucosa]
MPPKRPQKGYEYQSDSSSDSSPTSPPAPPTDAEIYAEQLRTASNPNGTRTSTRVKKINTSRFPGLNKLFFSETESTDRRLRKVHSNPNVYVIDKFLTNIELDHIAARCDLQIPKVQPAAVVQPALLVVQPKEETVQEEQQPEPVMAPVAVPAPVVVEPHPVPEPAPAPVAVAVAMPIEPQPPQPQPVATMPPQPMQMPNPVPQPLPLPQEPQPPIQPSIQPYQLNTAQPPALPVAATKPKKPRKKKQKKAAAPDEFGIRLAAALNASPIKSIPPVVPEPVVQIHQPVTQFYVPGSPPKQPSEPLTSPYLPSTSSSAKLTPKKLKKFKKSYTDDSTTLTRNDDDTNRTSTFTYFTKMEDSKIAAIEEKAASYCGTTIERVEPLQVVKYKPGQFFGAHHDTGVLFDDGSVEFPANPPRRVCTFFVYLNDVPSNSGGSTRFPLLKNEDGTVLEVQPVKGSAVLWSNITKEGDVDPLTVHEGVAITKGNKYGMNIWVTD